MMNVFLGFGKNRNMMTASKEALYRMGHEVVILEDCADCSQSVIEELEEFSNVDKAVMICSGDDNIKPYRSINTGKFPRQNVVFKIGYFAAKLGRRNVIILLDKRERLSLLSDFAVSHVLMGKKVIGLPNLKRACPSNRKDNYEG